LTFRSSYFQADASTIFSSAAFVSVLASAWRLASGVGAHNADEGANC
jgi:hypothetical protein